ncbi:MAG: hypothetical protein HQ516_03935 [Chlorobium sp.]|nr:hypothetical protein [Chlorobium sp.]
MDDTIAIHSPRWRVLSVVLLGVSVVMTGFLIHDGVQAARTLKTGYFPGFLFTTYLQSLTRLPREWEMAAVMFVPATSLVCSGLVAFFGFVATFTRHGRIRFFLFGIGLALLAANAAACYLIRKAYIAV